MLKIQKRQPPKYTGQFLLLLISVIAIACTAPYASAANGNTMLISWRSTGSAPSGYAGKIMPGVSSLIRASVVVVGADGNIKDTSGTTIYWYLNDDLIEGGKGKKQVFFLAPSQSGGIMNLQAYIPSLGGESLVDTLVIPIIPPSVRLKLNGANSVTAAPYYFTTDMNNIGYKWRINEVLQTETGNTIQVPSGKHLISVQAFNLLNSKEISQSQISTSR